MDQNEYAKERHNVLDYNPEKVLHTIEKPKTVDATPEKVNLLRNQTLETEFTSQTPEKTNQPLKIEIEGKEFELFQRHKDLVELFDGMSCSLRLLGLRKLLPTFQNIFAQVEVLTRRKFSHEHVAQLNYILPEAIQIDKILVHDKETLCMKPEMKIMLVFDVIDGHHEQSNFIALHQLFISRLVKYFIANPKATDVPLATLPDPFNQNKGISSEAVFGNRVMGIPEVIVSQASQTISSDNIISNDSLEDSPTTIEPNCLSKSSHISQSFRKHFSDKVLSETEKTNLNLITVSGNKEESLGIISKSTSIDPQPTLPVDSTYSIITNTCESPLLKNVATVDSSVLETPAQSIPRRVVPSSDDIDHNKGLTNQRLMSSSKPAKRSLDFSFVEGDESESCELFINRPQTRDASSAQLQKAEEVLDSAADEHKKSQAHLTDQHISVDLPGLVSLIHRIFQSVGYASITKDELVHKIIINNFDFEESGQVVEQIEKLEKLVPDWICKKLVPSGDTLYSIEKMSDLSSLQSRVACI